MSEQPIIQIKNLKKKIGTKTIIDGLSLDVRPGEVFGFLGPNGAGKTTTIRMLLGLISITEGEILINGHNITTDYEKAIEHVGGIVENPDMYKFLTGYQNLLHYSRMYTDIKKERIDEVVKIVGMEKRIHDKVKTYSLGMRQRLGVAQALLNSPSLIVLDEPTNGLDPAGIHELRSHLRDLAEKQNIAVFVSSHLLSEMEQMCDRVAIIQNGKLLRIENVRDLVEDKTNSVVALKVEPIEKAIECLKRFNDKYEPVIEAGVISILEDEANVPELVVKLVADNIKIFEVHMVQKSLEQKFLEMTGGNEIA